MTIFFIIFTVVAITLAIFAIAKVTKGRSTTTPSAAGSTPAPTTASSSKKKEGKSKFEITFSAFKVMCYSICALGALAVWFVSHQEMREIRKSRESAANTVVQSPAQRTEMPVSIGPGESSSELHIPRSTDVLFAPIVIDGPVGMRLITEGGSFTLILKPYGVMPDGCRKGSDGVIVFTDSGGQRHRVERVLSAKLHSVADYEVTLTRLYRNK